ncbi:hypothetical protein BU14_0399s0011 [Porphyra umbilicalis]|uniref:Uncharacterized protein n=1 Tax=Porphyra umbilicalis TaxID=2786 RepID=A0A1X6NW98_PORUM|nr:hypothetical protein BU14_0399s0011 [Porphyra umbilicalis]|eukprot:OSX72867.1 hypothetical protein BU14_0399s0011 [Porphyra umbilicalis]
MVETEHVEAPPTAAAGDESFPNGAANGAVGPTHRRSFALVDAGPWGVPLTCTVLSWWTGGGGSATNATTEHAVSDVADAAARGIPHGTLCSLTVEALGGATSVTFPVDAGHHHGPRGHPPPPPPHTKASATALLSAALRSGAPPPAARAAFAAAGAAAEAALPTTPPPDGAALRANAALGRLRAGHGVAAIAHCDALLGAGGGGLPRPLTVKGHYRRAQAWATVGAGGGGEEGAGGVGPRLALLDAVAAAAAAAALPSDGEEAAVTPAAAAEVTALVTRLGGVVAATERAAMQAFVGAWGGLPFSKGGADVDVSVVPAEAAAVGALASVT